MIDLAIDQFYDLAICLEITKHIAVMTVYGLNTSKRDGYRIESVSIRCNQHVLLGFLSQSELY